MFPQTTPAPLPRIQATSAYRRAVGSLRIALACSLIIACGSTAITGLHLPRGVIGALVIVDVVAAVGGLVASIVMNSARERLEREFPGVRAARAMSWTLTWVILRHAVTLRTTDKHH